MVGRWFSTNSFSAELFLALIIDVLIHLWYDQDMKKLPKPLQLNEIMLTPAEFLESYNKNIPEGYPHVSMDILQKFKESHLSLFKSNDLWSLDQHRKRMIDWLPQNI